MTFFYKRIFPVLWFGFLILIFLLIAVPLFFGGKQTEPPPYPMLVVPLAMIGFGYFFMKKLVFDLVDEVWEDGDSLVVKNRGARRAYRLCQHQKHQLLAVYESTASDCSYPDADNLRRQNRVFHARSVLPAVEQSVN